MDIFFEQLVKMKRTGKELSVVALYWLAAVVLIFLLYMVMMLSGGTFMSICLAAMVGVIYGAYKLSGRTSFEYEYIFTNGDLDIDKIIAKSSRKRLITVTCAATEKYGKYNPSAKLPGSVTKTYIACPVDHPDAHYMIVHHKTQGNVMIVFAPDERMREAIEKVVPRIAF